MKFFLTVLILVSIPTWLARGQSASSAGKPAEYNKPFLFIGKATANWLPKSELLPSAESIEESAKNLSVRKRNVDPFGLSTFPREEEKTLLIDETSRATERITLNQALQTLKLNGLNPLQKKFLIGGRYAAEGDVIQLSYKDEVFWAKVVEVGATQIHFYDLQRKESGILKHDFLPQLKITSSKEQSLKFEAGMTPIEPTPSIK
jgi:hypothetical protein